VCSWSRSSLSQRPTTAISGHQHLQSAVTSTLLVLRARTATSQQSFTVNGPATWNRLPPALWSPDLSDSAFKQALKTHLFLTARRHLDVFMILVPDLLTYFTDMAVIAIWHTFNFSLIIQTGRMWLIWLTLFTSLRLSFWLSHSSLSYGLSASLDIQDWQTPLSMGGAVAVWVASRPEACRLSQLQGCGFESAPLTSIA